MYKKILLILALISFTVNAQDTIRGKMKPVKNYSYIILNQLNTVNKKYVANATITNGEFKMAIPKGTKPGMYRLEYDVNNNLFVDFIYNNESIDFEFDPNYPDNLVKFNESEENKIFQSYIDGISVIQNKLDSVQVKYFQIEDKEELKKLTKFYENKLVELKKVQIEFTEKSKNKLAHHFINANKRHYSDTLIKNTDVFLKNLKSHYYDNIDL